MEQATPTKGGEAASAPEAAAEEPSFTSSHTTNFPALLRELGVSLLVSTYQAGKLIVIRADGDTLNTHFRDFLSPMGVAYEARTGRLAVGTRHQLWDFYNQPAVALKLEPREKHDAAFLPASAITRAISAFTRSASSRARFGR